MRFNAFTDYSLRVLMYLAADPQRRATIGEIAVAFKISENHLMKVVHALGKNGLLANVRGKGGGLALALPPEKINLGRAVRLIDGAPLPAECFDRLRNECCIAPVCLLCNVLEDAVNAFYSVLDRHTLADMVANRGELTSILHLSPRPPRTRRGR